LADPIGAIGRKTGVGRRIHMMHTLNNIVRLCEECMSSGVVNIIMGRNDSINFVWRYAKVRQLLDNGLPILEICGFFGDDLR